MPAKTLDIRAYTPATAPPWAAEIVTAIRGGDLAKGSRLFREAASTSGIERAVYAVAAVVEPGAGQLTVGPGPLVYGNPLRTGYCWRCGTCLATFRRGGPAPTAGVNYKTAQSARGAAVKHDREAHGGRSTVHELSPRGRDLRC
ncbi:hypothetical protein [Actinomadura litoris]|uniref:Uncharacterized protein n=1 Tax=Actinomadura litoris TaxID=2678616 RepID=A0A7K1LB21_9ACTN|nr:hypothetical protein [Actinomadura litoris]MUN41446.1 hypothetical protein [Actinomadura litoris]